MTEYLDREDVSTAGSVAVGRVLQVGDYGLLDAAVARPRTSVFGLDAYPDDFTKAAALLQSLARNHALVDGNNNKRTAWAAAWTLLYINGVVLSEFDVDDAEVFMNDVATRSDWDVGPLLTSRQRMRLRHGDGTGDPGASQYRRRRPLIAALTASPTSMRRRVGADSCIRLWSL